VHGAEAIAICAEEHARPRRSQTHQRRCAFRHRPIEIGPNPVAAEAHDKRGKGSLIDRDRPARPATRAGMPALVLRMQIQAVGDVDGAVGRPH
jgi:hypothetical protein